MSLCKFHWSRWMVTFVLYCTDTCHCHASQQMQDHASIILIFNFPWDVLHNCCKWYSFFKRGIFSTHFDLEKSNQWKTLNYYMAQSNMKLIFIYYYIYIYIYTHYIYTYIYIYIYIYIIYIYIYIFTKYLEELLDQKAFWMFFRLSLYFVSIL